MAVPCGNPTAGTGNRCGFTLIELLAVLVILGALAALVLGGGQHAVTTGKEAQARGELALLAAALEAYRRAHGDYPRTADPAQLLQALIGRRDPLGAALTGRAVIEPGDFTTVDGRDPALDASARLCDPWGRPYFYAYRTVAPWQHPAFLLASAGPDGALHATLAPGGYLDATHPDNADNVTLGR